MRTTHTYSCIIIIIILSLLSRHLIFIFMNAVYPAFSRRIVPDEPAQFPAVLLEQRVPAVSHGVVKQCSGRITPRPALRCWPVLQRLLTQSPPPGHAGILAPVTPPPPPSSVLARQLHQRSELGLPSVLGARRVRDALRPALQLYPSALGAAAQTAPGHRACSRTLALWHQQERSIQLGVDRSFHWDWIRYGTEPQSERGCR